jgi:hypothetical protein
MGKTIFACVYIGKKSFKILFFRTSRPLSIKLNTNHPCKREFKLVLIKDQVLYKGEKVIKIGHVILKIFFMIY